jgi:hypothetical protein
MAIFSSWGTGGATATGSDNRGVIAYNSSSIVSSNTGNIMLIGIAGGGGSNGIYTNGLTVGESGGDNMLGDIMLITDSLGLGSATITTDSTLTIEEYTDSTTIGLGSGTGTLSLSNTELAAMSAANFIFGSADSGDLDIDTTHDFADSHVTFKSGADIELSGTLTKATGAGTVNYVFEADENIFNSSSADIVRSDGVINLTFNSDKDADSDGAISLTGFAFTSNNGTFTAGGGADPTTTAAHAGQDGVYDIGIEFDGVDISTGSGNISIRGEGEDTGDDNYGVYAHTGTTLTTTTGTITLDGAGGAGTAGNYGFYLKDSSTVITSTGGDIDISGTANNAATGNSNYGIVVSKYCRQEILAHRAMHLI